MPADSKQRLLEAAIVDGLIGDGLATFLQATIPVPPIQKHQVFGLTSYVGNISLSSVHEIEPS
jgi:hypothetical protein